MLYIYLWILVKYDTLIIKFEILKFHVACEIRLAKGHCFRAWLHIDLIRLKRESSHIRPLRLRKLNQWIACWRHLLLPVLLNQWLMLLFRLLPCLIQTLKSLLRRLTLVKVDAGTYLSRLLSGIVIDHCRRKFMLLLNQYWLWEFSMIKVDNFTMLLLKLLFFNL